VRLNTLGRKERLKSRKSIEILFTQGKNFPLSPFRVYFIFPEKETSLNKFNLQFGAGVSTKNFKRAVDRNRIKRMIREAYRLQKNELQEKLIQQNRIMHVFVIYTGKDIPAYSDIFEKMKAVIMKLQSNTK
jgi:ribonuclease P protein component